MTSRRSRGSLSEWKKVKGWLHFHFLRLASVHPLRLKLSRNYSMNQNLADRLSPTPTPPLAPSRIGSATTTNRPRASHALPPAQNAVTVAYGARQYDASEAKKEAAEMMAALGINNNSELMRTSGSTATNTSSGVRREAGTVGRSAGKRNSTSIGLVANSNLLDEQLELLASSTSAASPDLVKHLQTALDERERELAALQARFDQLTKDKNREFLSLQTKYDQLERESNEVERLLTGYQHEAEKSSLAVEAMKNKCDHLALLHIFPSTDSKSSQSDNEELEMY